MAERLGLHVRTIRRYVRDGRLPAVRIGKQYRIAAQDLVRFTGRPAEAFRPEPVPRRRQVDVSTIVDIHAVSPETAHRITALLLGAANARSATEAAPRIETLYFEERGLLKIVAVGGLEPSAGVLQLIGAVLEP